MIINPFGIIMAVLNILAAGYEFFKTKNYNFVVMYTCYAVASIALGIRTK